MPVLGTVLSPAPSEETVQSPTSPRQPDDVASPSDSAQAASGFAGESDATAHGLSETVADLQATLAKLWQSERDARQKTEEARAQVLSLEGQVLKLEQQNAEHVQCQVQYVNEIDAKTSALDGLAKELDLQKKMNETKDHQIDQLKQELEVVFYALICVWR